MNKNTSGNISYLNNIRLNNGAETCRSVFRESYHMNGKKVADMINHPKMTFPSLYILLPQIDAFHLNQYLNPRNTAAVRFVKQVLGTGDTDNDAYLSANQDIVHSALKWMTETGIDDDMMNDNYEKVLDIAVSLLINTYQDKSILPAVDKMIFQRCKKGRNIHDLVWAFFRIYDPEALKLMAAHIVSSDPEESELACCLLRIEMPDDCRKEEDRQKQYEAYLNWLEENDPFLYFTGESLQFASVPAVCKVDLERKYIQKENDSYMKKPVVASNEAESRQLNAFQTLEKQNKEMLSQYSHHMRRRGPSEWAEWIGSPIDQQIKTAMTEMEGMKCL